MRSSVTDLALSSGDRRCWRSGRRRTGKTLPFVPWSRLLLSIAVAAPESRAWWPSHQSVANTSEARPAVRRVRRDQG